LRIVSGTFVEKIKKNILYSKNVVDNREVYEIIWKNIVESDKPKAAI
jgi:hypothetical protein